MKKYILAVLLFLLNISMSIQAQNLITNSDFETGTLTNWTFVLTSKATASIVNDTIHSGTYALKIQVDTLGATDEDIQLTHTKFADKKGFVYNFSFWAKSDSQNYLISVEFKDTLGLTLFDKKDFTLSKSWTKYTFVFIGPNTTKNFAKFFINVKSLGSSYFDDFSLNQVNTNWMQGANYRIEKYRKGDFSIKVLDSLGNPASDSVFIKLIRHEFPWGTAQDFNNSWEMAMSLKFFNCGVFGNLFKWPYMEPSPGIYSFGNVNNALTWANKVGWSLRGHCLLWGDSPTHDANKLPDWVRTLTPAKAIYDTSKNRIVNTMTYYKGKINDYDVLNEPTHANWLQSQFGDSINWKSFKWARATDSTAQLYLNDYNTIEQNDNEYGAFIQVLRKIFAHGGPVSGIGIQAHFGNVIDENVIVPRLDSMAQFGLPLKITEFDFNMSALSTTPQQQATGYAKMMRLAFSYPSINGFMFWGYWNGDQWRQGGIFETDKTPKIAADSVYNLIHKEWSTNINGITSSDGSLAFRGFYGDYEITVKAGDSLKIFTINCTKANDGKEFVLKENQGEIAGPELIKAAITNFDTLELTFNKEMNDPSTEIANFSIYDQNANTISLAKLKPGFPNVIVMHINRNLTFTNVVTISYLPGGIKSIDGGKLEAFNMVDVSNPLPGIISKETDTTGNFIEISFNGDMNDPSSQISAFTVKVNSVIDTILSVGLKPGNASVLILSLKRPVMYGEAVLFAYTPGSLTSANGFPIPKVNSSFVVNKVPQPTSVLSFQANEVKLFPNPAQNVVRISNLNGINRITISSILGQELYRNENISGPSIEINLSGFTKGLYIISFNGSNIQAKAMKLIKY